jgi:HPt (histidine-containing phosphotransfer) domain-containing protein
MEMKYKRQLLSAGTDLDSTLDRFMNNEDLYEKFLVKFLEDKNFSELKKNLELKKYEEAFINAHTLKGVSANLGLDAIYNVLIPMVEELRNNNYNENNYEFKLLEENYNELCDIIKENSSLRLTS